MSDRNSALDGIRALAILWVFAFHAQALLPGAAPLSPATWSLALAERGLLGVQLFFVLSGFLLALPWMVAASQQRPYPRPGLFWKRRAQRILPAYWFHLAVLFGVILPILRGSHALLATEIGVMNLGLHTALLHFLHPGSSSSLGLNMALWSLSLEAQFYLLLPLLAPLFVGDRVLIALPAAICVSVIWRTWAPDLLIDWMYLEIRPSHLVFFDPVSARAGPFPPGMMRFFLERQLPGEIAAFAFGMAVANLYHRLRCRPLTSGITRVLGPLSLALLLLIPVGLIQVPLSELFTGSMWRTIGWPLYLGACSLVILAAALRTPVIAHVLGSTLLATLGLVSYSFYLWHEPLLRLLATDWLSTWLSLLGCNGSGCRIALALAMGLVVAGLSYRWLEQPRQRRTKGSVPEQ